MKIDIKKAGLVWWVVDKYYSLLPEQCKKNHLHEDLEQEVYLIALEANEKGLEGKEFFSFAQKKIYRFVVNNFYVKKMKGGGWWNYLEINDELVIDRLGEIDLENNNDDERR